MTAKLVWAERPAASVALQMTVVEPTGKTEPDDGTQLTLALEQLSVADGVG
jgi:hypothetical protein